MSTSSNNPSIHLRGASMKAETMATSLGGHRTGGGWMAHCPAHDDHKPSLSIRAGKDGKVLVHCHAGCEQGQVIAALRSQGLWDRVDQRPAALPAHSATGDERAPHAAKRLNRALEIWRCSRAVGGTPVQVYLASRGVTVPPAPRLRFHPALRHPSGSISPAMVALVTGGVNDAPLAVHRTFLARDGVGKAPVAPQRMLLGSSRGGAVRLSAPGDELMIGEGIETCLAAMQATCLPAWAALSTSGLKNLDLPEAVRNIIVLADGDEAGEVAARDCARRWWREGRKVRIARAPWGFDFNDLLMRGARDPERAA